MVQVAAVGKVSMLVKAPEPPVIISPAIRKLYEIQSTIGNYIKVIRTVLKAIVFNSSPVVVAWARWRR